MWFDSPDKLDYPRLPPYCAWYSQLKGAYVLSPKEYDDCKRIFQERGMRTFSDWLEYYNNLDVAPFLQALQKMKEFYTTLVVDAVFLPGVSQQYILRKTLKGHKGYKPPKLYAPNKEAYDMLKAAVVGGPSRGVHAQARGGRDQNRLPPIRRCESNQAHPGVRRQFALPQHHDEGDALR